MNDHDLLICIDTKLKDLKEDFRNHLQHHFKYSVIAWTTTLSLVVALIIMLLE